jgi:hypothetical protein
MDRYNRASQAALTKADRSLWRLKYLLCSSVAVGLGFLHAWLGRAAVHGLDGVSYLDLGDAYMKG